MTLVEDQSEGHYRLRAACRCGSTDGVITTVNGQDTVRCAQCARFCYNAPRSETGRPRRTHRSRAEISPSQRHRIFARDKRTCFVDGWREGEMHIGHIISVFDGRLQGMTDAELFHDDNLVVLCAQCNSGQGRKTMSLPLVVAALRAAGREVPIQFLVAILRARIASTAGRNARRTLDEW